MRKNQMSMGGFYIGKTGWEVHEIIALDAETVTYRLYFKHGDQWEYSDMIGGYKVLVASFLNWASRPLEPQETTQLLLTRDAAVQQHAKFHNQVAAILREHGYNKPDTTAQELIDQCVDDAHLRHRRKIPQ